VLFKRGHITILIKKTLKNSKQKAAPVNKPVQLFAMAD